MNVVDSSAWLEYFADGPNAPYFTKAILKTNELVVPTIVVHEVFKKVLRERGEDEALRIAAVLQQGQVADLDVRVALDAARLGAELELPLADAAILATTRAYDAVLWTQDADFEGMEGVRYRQRHG